MKLLIFFIFFQINIYFEVGFGLFSINKAQAAEVADGSVDNYEARYQRWLNRKNNKVNSSSAAKTIAASSAQSEAQLKLQANLKKLESELQVIKTKNLRLPASLPSRKIESQDVAPVSSNVTQRRVRDAREDFLSNIPKDNKQVRALLSMVDHTKVYFSINSDGKLKDLFKDDRFREIYTEEMDKPTKKLTYDFFKAYQDANRNPNEPVAQRLNRDIKINREKIENYLETSGIKSKLTRSLRGSYPKAPVSMPDADSNNNVNVGGTSAPATE
jgi:hypothetical protein